LFSQLAQKKQKKKTKKKKKHQNQLENPNLFGCVFFSSLSTSPNNKKTHPQFSCSFQFFFLASNKTKQNKTQQTKKTKNKKKIQK